MRQPLWLLNSILLVAIFGALLFVLYSTVKVPTRTSIAPIEQPEPKKKEALAKINLEIIYTNDLFNTFQAPAVTPKKPELAFSLPQPPQPISVTIPKPPAPQFLEPLPLTLTGVILFDNKNKSRAMILDNKTRKEALYKLEDEIEDAQLIRIFKNKVILLRSNGQQEVLYLKEDLRPKDDPSIKKNWSALVTRVEGETNKYLINPHEFVHVVKTLPDFIMTFNVVTAIDSGKTIGLKIGTIRQDSLVQAMGLRLGDIITAVNNIPTITPANRLAIYNEMLSLNDGDSVKVSILRNRMPLTFTYKLAKRADLHAPATLKEIEEHEVALALKKQLQEVPLEKTNIEEDYKKFAPTLKDIRLRDKEHIFQYKQSPKESKTEALE